MESREAQVPGSLTIFGANFGRLESRRKPQEPSSSSSKDLELPPTPPPPPPSSSSSSSSPEIKTLNLTPTPTSILGQCSTSTRTTNIVDRSREIPMVAPSQYNKVSTELCLFDKTWEWNPTVSYVPRKLSAKEQETARRITRMKFQSRREKEEERRKGVSTELSLGIVPWTIKKKLTSSDLGSQSRLLLPTGFVQDHILKHLSEDDRSIVSQGGLRINVLDHDTGTSHQLRMKIWGSSRSYVLIGGWTAEFVHRRRLNANDEVGLSWNRFDSKLHFCVLDRAAANPQNPN